MARESKLIRDRILEIILKKGGKCSFHIADKREFEKRLKDKLKEEVGELCEKLDKEEIADVFEVLDTILKFKKYKKIDILKIQQKKRKEKGGFDRGIVLDKY